MTPVLPPIPTMRRAFADKDPSFDGLFIVAVKTTGVCCRPVCRARPPRPENIEFFPNISAALAAGYRPCKRCRPEHTNQPTPPLVAQLLALLDHHPGQKVTTLDLIRQGIDPSTARRQFLAHTGTTFARYQRQRRLGAAMKLARPTTAPVTVTATQLAAGFDSASGFRDAAEKLFGLPPSSARDLPILTSTWITTPLGPMLAIARDHSPTHPAGLVLLDFADRRSLETAIVRLRHRFAVDDPSARHNHDARHNHNARTKLPAAIVPGHHPILTQTAHQIADYFSGKSLTFTLPLAPAGTDFQLRCWNYLRTIPPAQVHTYGQQAKAIGSPAASRAVGLANGMNYLAILIPCHRVCGTNGKLTGYGGGLHRKAWLLDHERRHAK